MNLSIFDELAEKSWTVQNDWLTASELSEVQDELQRLDSQRLWKKAEVKAPFESSATPPARTDLTHWLVAEDSPISARLLEKIENLRQELNQNLYLGLTHFEAHFARYQPGGYYEAHLDRARAKAPGTSERVISMVAYLNETWTASDRGELTLYLNQDPAKIDCEIQPSPGRLVLFRSDQVLHAVQSPQKTRHSLTCWFRRP